MIKIEKYRADDGTEFEDQHACVNYEDLCHEIGALMSLLAPNTIRGEDFVQQSGPTFLYVQQRLVLIYERLNPGLLDQHTEWARNATRNAGMTLIGRYIDEGHCRPLQRAWYRIMCTDHKFREYEQLYFAIQADKDVVYDEE